MLYHYAYNVCNEFRLPTDEFNKRIFLVHMARISFGILMAYLVMYIAAIAFIASSPAAIVVGPIVVVLGGLLLIFLANDAGTLKFAAMRGGF